MALPFKSALLKGLLVKKAVVVSAAALAAVSTVGTVAAISAGSLAVSSQPEQSQSAVVASQGTTDTDVALPGAAPLEELAAAPEGVPAEDTEDAALPAQAMDDDKPGPAASSGRAETVLPKANSAAPGIAPGDVNETGSTASAADVPASSAPQAPAAQSSATARDAAPASAASAALASTDPAPAATAPAAPAPEPAPAPAPTPAPVSSSATHTTSIYQDESTLLRKEYYNENNQLYEYSDVHDYNHETKSYTENIYRYDEETGQEILVRTDVYENGVLVASY